MCRVVVETPVNLTKRQQELLREFEKAGDSHRTSPESEGFFAPRARVLRGFARIESAGGLSAATWRERRAPPGGGCLGALRRLGEHVDEMIADVLELAIVLDLVAEEILHIEDVDHLFAVCRDLGARDLQVKRGQGPR